MFVGSQTLKPLPHFSLVSSFNITTNFFFSRVKSDDPNCQARKITKLGRCRSPGSALRRSDLSKIFCTTLHHTTHPLEFFAPCTLRKLQRGEFPQTLRKSGVTSQL